MPILNVEIVLGSGERLSADLARRLADRTGQVLEAPLGTTWVKLLPIPRSQYAESGGSPEPGVYPVLVTVIKARLPEADALEKEAAALTAAVAEVCGRSPDNVHIYYLPEGVGRIAFGGRLRKT